MRDNEREALVALVENVVRESIESHCPRGKWITGPNTLAISIKSGVLKALAAPAEAIDSAGGAKCDLPASMYGLTHGKTGPFDYTKPPPGARPDSHGVIIGSVSPQMRDASAASPTMTPQPAGGEGCGICGGYCDHPELHTPQPAEGDGAVLPAGYKVQRHIFGKWMYVVDDHGSANYWDTRDEAVQKAWEHHERQLTRQAATAQVPEGFVLVPKELTGLMLDIAIDEHDGFHGEDEVDSLWAAMLAAAPAAPKGGVDDVLYTAEEVAEAMEVLRGRKGSTVLVTEVLDAMEQALTAALATGEQP